METLKSILVIAGILVTTITAQTQEKDFPKLTGPYLGQKSPGITPEKFAPGIVSTDGHEFSCCFSPDGKEFYFARRDPTVGTVVMVSEVVNGVWTEPTAAPLGEEFTFEPFITPDNKRLYFQSGRVVANAPQMVTLYVERTEKGWGTAQDPGNAFNPNKTMHISSTLNGTVYTTDITGGGRTKVNNKVSGPGKECLGMIKLVNGKYEKLEKLGPPFNNGKRSMHPWIAPDESYIIYAEEKPEQQTGSVLFFSLKKKDGTWDEPKEIKLGMDSGMPFVTNDGKYLFFTSGEKQKSDIYWVSTKIIETLKPK
jgi:hypothetical protein